MLSAGEATLGIITALKVQSLRDGHEIMALREEKRCLNAAAAASEAVLIKADRARVEAETRLLYHADQFDLVVLRGRDCGYTGTRPATQHTAELNCPQVHYCRWLLNCTKDRVPMAAIAGRSQWRRIQNKHLARLFWTLPRW